MAATNYWKSYAEGVRARQAIQAGQQTYDYNKLRQIEAQQTIHYNDWKQKTSDLVEQQREEYQDLSNAIALYGYDPKDPKTVSRLHDAVMDTASKHHDHVLQNYLVQGGPHMVDALVRYRDSLGGKAAELLRQQIEQEQLKKAQDAAKDQEYWNGIANKYHLEPPARNQGETAPSTSTDTAPPPASRSDESPPASSAPDTSPPVLPEQGDDGSLHSEMGTANHVASDAPQPTEAGQQVAQADEPTPQGGDTVPDIPEGQRGIHVLTPPAQTPAQKSDREQPAQPATPLRTPDQGNALSLPPIRPPQSQAPTRPASTAQPPQPPAEKPQPTAPRVPGTVHVYVNPPSMQPDQIAKKAEQAHPETTFMAGVPLPAAVGIPELNLTADQLDAEAHDSMTHAEPERGTGSMSRSAWIHNQAVTKRRLELENYLRKAFSQLRPGIKLNAADYQNIENALRKADPTLAFYYHAFRLGRMILPMTGYAANSPYWNTIRGIILVGDPDYTPARYEAYKRTILAFDGSNPGSYAFQSRTAANRVLQHIGMGLDAIDALRQGGSGNVRALNALRNRIGSELGYTTPVTWDEIGKHISQELERVFRGTGGSWHSIEGQMKLLDSGNAPDQLESILRADAALLYGQLEALAYMRNMGIGAVDPTTGEPDPSAEGYTDAMHMMSPGARAVFRRMFSTRVENGREINNYPREGYAVPDPRRNPNWQPDIGFNNPNPDNQGVMPGMPPTNDVQGQHYLPPSDIQDWNNAQPGDRSMIGVQ